MNNFIVQMVVGLLVQLYKAGGHSAVVRALTVPRAQVAAITAKTGADLDEAIAARDAFAEAAAVFAEQMVVPESAEDAD